MKVTALLLADSASVREGLLHVLGAGITRIARDPLPARLDVALALMFRADDQADLVASHNLEVIITETSPGSAGRQVAKVIAEMGLSPGTIVSPGLNLLVPVVVPIQPVPIPSTGSYAIEVSLDGEAVGSYEFEVVKGADLQPVTPSGT